MHQAHELFLTSNPAVVARYLYLSKLRFVPLILFSISDTIYQPKLGLFRKLSQRMSYIVAHKGTISQVSNHLNRRLISIRVDKLNKTRF